MIKFLFMFFSFDVLKYQPDFVINEKLFGIMVLIMITFFNVWSFNNFLNQLFKNGQINIETFIYVKRNANRIADT